MKKLCQVAALCVAITFGAFATADGFLPIPDEGTEFGPSPVPEAPFVGEIVPGPVVHYDTAPEPLFTRVKYVDLREKHPCAVEKIIQVNDPCVCKKLCDCGEPSCVFIRICVPPCGCEDVRCRKGGDRLRYDYGKYKVDVRVKKGFIVVDYQK